MTRIIAGTARGRRLATPPGSSTRPTSDRVREALFSRLEHYDALDGAAVLDLYAGSGALGFEALSRGAEHATFVEIAAKAAGVIRRNAAELGMQGRVRVVQAKAVAALAGAGVRRDGGYDLVLIDPPYDLAATELAGVLAALAEPGGGHLAERALIVLEQSSRAGTPPWPEGLAEVDSRTYGETVLWFAEPA